MTSSQFLEEVKNSNICPDNFEVVYDEFRSFQCDALDTLKEVHRVCELNKITYELAYGPLLGLVRDGGQIPWDYDVDIIVPFEERKKLVEALNKDLNDQFYYYSPDNNPKCRHMIMRIAPKEYRTEVLHVDVFFLVGTPEDSADRKKFANKLHQISKMRFGKLVNIKEESLGKPGRYLKLLLRRKVPSLFWSLKYIEREYKRLCGLYSSYDASFCVTADTFASNREIPTNLLWETKLVRCSYGEVRIPIHYKELLNLIYGDYQNIPPLSSRINEVLFHYERIKKFQQFL